jgi:hypothetical protein
MPSSRAGPRSASSIRLRQNGMACLRERFGEHLAARQIGLRVQQQLRPDVNYLNSVNEVPQLLDANTAAALLFGKLLGTAPGPRDDYERADVPRHVVQAGKHLIHKIEIDLAQAQRVDAAKATLLRSVKLGASASAAARVSSAREGCAMA